MVFHRGSWVAEKGVSSVDDVFRSNESDFGTTTMHGQQTSSWQRFYPHEEQELGYGYDCNSFARAGAYKEKGRKPVIVEFQIPDAETYSQYNKYLKLVLRRGHETDISQDASLVTVDAVIVDASRFTFDDFAHYRGELLVEKTISEAGIKMVEDLQCTMYEASHTRYNEFAAAYNEGKVRPLYTTEHIVHTLSRGSVEGSAGSYA